MKVTITVPAFAAALELYLIKENMLVADSKSRRIIKRWNTADNAEDDSDDDVMVDESNRVTMTLGVGAFTFLYNNKIYTFVRELMGDPLPSMSCEFDSVIHEDISVSSEDPEATPDEIHELIKQAVKDNKKKGYIPVFVYDSKRGYWDDETKVQERTIESVILDSKLKKNIMDEISDFSAPETKKWYKKHGIPYKRGLLLYGPPGNGKSSMIRAIATSLERHIYVLKLDTPDMCDNALMAAVNTVSSKSVIVLEDIDTLFHERESSNECQVTFSGLLNAMDGINNTMGQIFILTSNLLNKLDPALKRAGRIDSMHKFDNCKKQQAFDMFRRFYADSEEQLADFFSNTVPSNTCMSTVQDHFIRHRKSTALTASKFTKTNAEDDELLNSIYM